VIDGEPAIFARVIKKIEEDYGVKAATIKHFRLVAWSGLLRLGYEQEALTEEEYLGYVADTTMFYFRSDFSPWNIVEYFLERLFQITGDRAKLVYNEYVYRYFKFAGVNKSAKWFLERVMYYRIRGMKDGLEEREYEDGKQYQYKKKEE